VFGGKCRSTVASAFIGLGMRALWRAGQGGRTHGSEPSSSLAWLQHDGRDDRRVSPISGCGRWKVERAALGWNWQSAGEAEESRGQRQT
jgi:hypothetical protein